MRQRGWVNLSSTTTVSGLFLVPIGMTELRRELIGDLLSVEDDEHGVETP